MAENSKIILLMVEKSKEETEMGVPRTIMEVKERLTAVRTP